MDSDFHYYGTGTAALHAGFKTEDAILIANAAQYVDWFDSDYWSYWNIVDAQGGSLPQYRYANPQLTIQKIDAKMIVDYNKHIWNAFHFPPGNLPYQAQQDGWRNLFCSQHVVRETRLPASESNKLCRPYSKFAHDLIVDTLQKFEQFSSAGPDELAELIADLVAPRIRCPVEDGRRLALFLLGLRMHVLADTWAHQDFTGEQSNEINGAGTLNRITAKDEFGQYQKTVWTGTVWALRDDTDCAAAPVMPGDGPCAGHGQIGHFADYSWLTFRYPASWLPQGQQFHVRDNPREYREAWAWLAFVMSLCRGSQSESEPPALPDDIDNVIGTWHELSTEGLVAIPESEECWRQTKLGQQIPARWHPLRRRKLGLFDGLATTRYGSINVIRNSVLHLMETAASIHYQFCVDWLATNSDYTWAPWRPKT